MAKLMVCVLGFALAGTVGKGTGTRIPRLGADYIPGSDNASSTSMVAPGTMKCGWPSRSFVTAFLLSP